MIVKNLPRFIRRMDRLGSVGSLTHFCTAEALRNLSRTDDLYWVEGVQEIVWRLRIADAGSLKRVSFGGYPNEGKAKRTGRSPN